MTQIQSQDGRNATTWDRDYAGCVWWPWRRVVLPRPRVQTNEAVAHISVIICFSFLSRSAMLELVLLR